MKMLSTHCHNLTLECDDCAIILPMGQKLIVTKKVCRKTKQLESTCPGYGDWGFSLEVELVGGAYDGASGLLHDDGFLTPTT
jgi:hypothetical protein